MSEICTVNDESVLVSFPSKLYAIEPDWSSTSTMSHGAIEVVVVT